VEPFEYASDYEPGKRSASQATEPTEIEGEPPRRTIPILTRFEPLDGEPPLAKQLDAELDGELDGELDTTDEGPGSVGPTRAELKVRRAAQNKAKHDRHREKRERRKAREAEVREKSKKPMRRGAKKRAGDAETALEAQPEPRAPGRGPSFSPSPSSGRSRTTRTTLAVLAALVLATVAFVLWSRS
jgi:hypothetical protein